MYRISNAVESVECNEQEMLAVCARLAAQGPITMSEVNENGAERYILKDGVACNEEKKEETKETTEEPKSFAVVAVPMPSKSFSDWGEGKQIVDDEAKARIEAQQKALQDAGVKVDASEQFYSTGTRLAESGYATQRKREQEFLEALPIVDAAHALANTVRSEKRIERECSALEFAQGIEVNGKISAFGYTLSQQAIRGLLARLKSPAMSYIFGLRDRIAEEVARGFAGDKEAIAQDKRRIAEVLEHECRRRANTVLQIRARENPHDIFAIVSDTYGFADAPESVDALMRYLPRDARGTWSYDPTSTAWELRANVWTPTPVDQQAVGEPFQGYASFSGRDNGTSKWRAGGGVMLIRCLNASTYSAETSNVARVHRGHVLFDVARASREALQAINALTNAWGVNRTQVVEVPEGVPIEEAIPGFYRWMLRDRKSEMAAVLTGRTESHVSALSKLFESERRNEDQITRADLANGMTRYAQGFRGDVQRDIESAVGSFLVKMGKVGWQEAKVSA